MKYLVTVILALIGVALPAQTRPTEAQNTGRPIRVLFLGHDQERPHPTPALYHLLASPLARRGIQLTHVNTPAEALKAAKLAHYDGLLIYGNHKTITPEQEKALVAFVDGGKGLIALHSASEMVADSPRYGTLLGASVPVTPTAKSSRSNSHNPRTLCSKGCSRSRRGISRTCTRSTTRLAARC